LAGFLRFIDYSVVAVFLENFIAVLLPMDTVSCQKHSPIFCWNINSCLSRWRSKIARSLHDSSVPAL